MGKGDALMAGKNESLVSVDLRNSIQQVLWRTGRIIRTIVARDPFFALVYDVGAGGGEAVAFGTLGSAPVA